MQVRRLVATLLGAALMTSCTPGEGSTPSPTPPEPRPPVTSELPVVPAPDGLRRVTYESTMEIPSPGLYLVDLKTGKVEGWQAQERRPIYLSEDRRWVISDLAGQVYWANRATGDVFGWITGDLRLLAAGQNRFLFAKFPEGDDRRTYYIADATFQVQQTFTLDQMRLTDTKAQFAPDGKAVALSSGLRTYVVDLSSGTSRLLDAPATGQSAVEVSLLGPASDALVVSYLVQVAEPTGLTREESIVRRYSWQGQLLSEVNLPGRANWLSPDGRMLYSNQEVDHLVQAAVVTDLTTDQTLFRVMNSFGEAWTADSAKLLVWYPVGGQYFVSTEGDLNQAPAVPPGNQAVFRPRLVPAPGDPGRFAAGLSVLNEGGQVLQRIDLPKRDDWMVANPSWGATADELVLSVQPLVGKDGDYSVSPPLPPQVQKPPFPSPYLLRVQDPQGECLNLRESLDRSSRVVRCLPTGTKLAVADLSQAPVKMNGALYHNDEQLWLWARTEQGETGWVSLSAGSVTWTW